MALSIQTGTSALYSTFTKSVTPSKNIEKSGPEQLSFMMKEQSFTYSTTTFELQIGVANDPVQSNHEAFSAFLESIGYTGGPIAELSQDEAAELVSEDGFFGVSKAAERIAGFVLNGAGNEESLLRAGREGILQGFKEAEAIWGDTLPDISYQTINKAVEMIDSRLHKLGYSVLSEEA